jgi:4-diphosphocytidyl-2-C-methyl-D-erythritol kinase
VLLVLNSLWGTRLARAALMQLGARLGADVPLFVFGRNALGEGAGERLAALSLAAAWYLVLVPPVSVATAAIFGDNALTRNTKALKIPPFFRGLGRNDLEAVAVRRHPEIGVHLEWLRTRRRDARMTGSGACVFAEFDSDAEARALLAELPDGMRGFVARGLEHHPLHDWAN